MSDTDLERLERLAHAGDTPLHRAAQSLANEVRRLAHELADPRYHYAGGRINRMAILCREAEIERLRAEIKDKQA